jgi:hypothetical protein
MANEFKIKNGLVVSGSADFEQDLTVRGTITADQLIISIVSSSVLFESGSTQFGNSIEDTHKITGSLLMTGSIDLNGQPVETGRLAESTFSTYSGTTNTRITNLETSTGSINSFTSSTDSRLSSIETSTGSLNTYSASNTTNIDAIHTSTGSLNTYTSSNTTNINAIHTSTGSLNSYTSSNTTNINAIHTATSSLNSYSASNTTNIDAIHTSTGSLNTYTSSNTTNINAIHTATSSLNSYTSSNNTVIGTLQTATSSLNSYTSSNTTNINAIHTATSSLNSFTSSIDTTIKNKLNNEGVITGSVQVNITSTTGYSTFSSSIATTDLNQENRLSSIEGKTGSYATTGSNTFKSNQTISGSVIITENLTVFGSSSITYVTSSQLRVEDNIITVNTASPGSRFGGLEVHDSGSVGIATGSLLWDSVNNRWIYQNSSEASYGGGVLLSGPRSSGSLGSELTLTSGRVAKSAGGDHLNDSNITDNGSLVIINSNTEITGTFVVTGTALVSGSSQISFNGITDKPTLVSGSSQITFLSISSIPSGLVSGSSQVLNESGVWSGSAQLPSGVVSGSSQVLAGTTIHSGAFFNGISVVSGSGQISFNGITDKPSLVSGSSQITYGSLTGIPSGIVSGSSQVLSGTGIWSGSAQLPSGVVSGSSQISFGSISGIPSGLVSGSSQISFGSISSIPSGLVSGSSQITLSSTTGFGSYLNQAVLTSSSPTFAAVSATTFTGALNGNATTATTAGALTSMNISQFTNNSGYITGIAFSSVSSKPTTLSGYGITDSLYQDRATINVNSFNATGLYRGSTSGWTNRPTSVHNGGALLTIDTHPGDYHSQLFFDTGGDRLYFRNANAASWGSWLTIYHSGNLTNLNQLTNGPGYITSYTETDTLATVTARGASTSTALTLSGNLTASAYVVIGGGYGNNAYSAVDSTRLMFGGGDSDAIGNYYIGTNKEDYGGNYTKLDLRWHTGIRMGAQAGYGGIRFYNSEDLGSVLFSIGTGDGNVRSHTNLIPSANNSYNLGSTTLGWANVYTNDLHLSNMNKPEGNDIDGTSGNWTIQEGAENLYIINNNNGKKFKISLEEIK